MSETFNFEEAEASIKEYLEVGEYNVRVASVEKGMSKANAPMITVDFEDVETGSKTNKTYLTFTEKAIFNVVLLLGSAGYRFEGGFNIDHVYAFLLGRPNETYRIKIVKKEDKYIDNATMEEKVVTKHETKFIRRKKEDLETIDQKLVLKEFNKLVAEMKKKNAINDEDLPFNDVKETPKNEINEDEFPF